MSGGHFVGCLGFESFGQETDWSEETIVLLRMAGEIFYSTLRRRRVVEELRDSQSQLQQVLVESQPDRGTTFRVFLPCFAG